MRQWPGARCNGLSDRLHVHGNGRHLLEAVSTIRGLKAIFLGDDRGYPAAFDILPELRTRTGDVPLVVEVDLGRFTEQLDVVALARQLFRQPECSTPALVDEVG